MHDDTIWTTPRHRPDDHPGPGGPGGSVLPARVDDLVLGAGITGLTTALLLARAGRRVAVVGPHEVADLTTGHSTAKLTLLQGTRLSTILRHHSTEVATAYLEANREGEAWVRRFCDDHGVGLQSRPAVTFAAVADERRAVEQEHAAAERVGLPVRWEERLEVPFPTHGATVLDDQAQVDPRELADALADQLLEHGGTLHLGHRATSLALRGDRATVGFDDGQQVIAEDVVLATGIPVFDRGLYFAKVEPQRSYVLALAGVDAPEAMLVSAGSSSRSLRDAAVGGETVLVLGGAGHTVGRTASEAGHVAELRAWGQEFYPGGRELARWSAQDYSSSDAVPHVGVMPRSRGRVHVATGFGKWGMTNGPAAALAIAGDVLGSKPSWARTLQRRVGGPRSAASVAAVNAGVGVQAALGVVRTARPSRRPGPAEETGTVGRQGLQPVARSRTAAGECALSARCSHLGGIVRWNDAEQTWDCPWHGSRFRPDGSVVEGPATRPLRRLDEDRDRQARTVSPGRTTPPPPRDPA